MNLNEIIRNNQVLLINETELNFIYHIKYQNRNYQFSILKKTFPEYLLKENNARMFLIYIRDALQQNIFKEIKENGNKI